VKRGPGLFVLVTLTYLVACLAVASGEVEVPPHWRSGDLAVYLFGFPQDGDEMRGSASVSIAVWNADLEEPVKVLLDGETAVTLDHEGYFQYSWKLRGSHHLAVTTPYGILEEATFWVKPPAPAPPTIPVSEFLAKLEEQKDRIILTMVMATACGVPAGIYTKKKTRIRSDWGFTIPGLFMVAGLARLDILYMFIPFGVAYALVYYLAREYADRLAVTVVEEGMISTFTFPVDSAGTRVIEGVSPRYWREGFIRWKKLTLERVEHSIIFNFMEHSFKCITVKGLDNLKITDDEVAVTASPVLALALTKSDLIEDLKTRLAEADLRLLFTEQALQSVVTQIIMEIERTMRDLNIDKVATIGEAKQALDKTGDRITEMLADVQLEESPNVQTPAG
jgi:hypothetical protein